MVAVVDTGIGIEVVLEVVSAAETETGSFDSGGTLDRNAISCRCRTWSGLITDTRKRYAREPRLVLMRIKGTGMEPGPS